LKNKQSLRHLLWG